MAFPGRPFLIVLGSIVALMLLIAIAIPLFLNADSFRTRIESALTTSLGRKGNQQFSTKFTVRRVLKQLPPSTMALSVLTKARINV